MAKKPVATARATEKIADFMVCDYECRGGVD